MGLLRDRGDLPATPNSHDADWRGDHNKGHAHVCTRMCVIPSTGCGRCILILLWSCGGVRPIRSGTRSERDVGRRGNDPVGPGNGGRFAPQRPGGSSVAALVPRLDDAPLTARKRRGRRYFDVGVRFDRRRGSLSPGGSLDCPARILPACPRCGRCLSTSVSWSRSQRSPRSCISRELRSA